MEGNEKAICTAKSLIIRYERVKSTDLISTVASGGFLPAEWTFAHKGDRWLLQRRFTEPGKKAGVNIHPEPKTSLVRDGLLLEWEGADKLAMLFAFTGTGDIYSGLYYTTNLSIDAPKYIFRTSDGTKDLRELHRRYPDYARLPFLPEFLQKNVARYQVLPDPKEIAGMRCWAVEWPGMDIIYVSVDHGFAVPQRKYCWDPGKPPRFEFHNGDYREVKPGLWLPFKQVVDRYASVVAEREALWGKVACRTEYRVKSIEFDDVPDSVFDVHLPKGTFVNDLVRRFSYVVSQKGNSDPFTAPLIESKQVLQRSSQRVRLVVVCILLFLAVACLVWRRRRKHLMAP